MEKKNEIIGSLAIENDKVIPREKKRETKKNITQWFVPANPNKYHVIEAFRELRKVDWRQSSRANIVHGDIVYIYVADPIQAIRFKCKVNKVNLESLEIDDRKYCIAEEFKEPKDRLFMELELIEEYEIPAFNRSFLEIHGFSAPQGPVRVKDSVKKYMDLIQKIKDTNEMNPDSHDGSYELMRETIKSYEKMKDLSECDYKDLNLVYLTSVGTWSQGIDSKQKMIKESHLPEVEKERLSNLLNNIWKKSERNEYENHEREKASLGLFGTGFLSFKGKTDDLSPRNFIQMCIDIINVENDDEIFNRCEQTLGENYHGMKSASASMVLHCLKPYTFPIFNSNMGSENIYSYFGISLDKEKEISTYIKNCREVKKFRDANFSIKNYRIFDIAAWNLRNEKNRTEINYLSVLDYLNNYRDIPYSKPDDQSDPAKKEEFLKIKRKGKAALEELKKMARKCQDEFNLDKCMPMQWLDGSNTKTRNYLWAQLKYSQFEATPISISLVVEPSEKTKKTRYRFSLEIKNDGADNKQRETYHSYLDVPLDDESVLVYAVGSNELGVPVVVDETADVIKEKLKRGEYKKVQLCRILEWTDELTNDDCEEAMIDSVSELIPYYEHVVGIEKKKENTLNVTNSDFVTMEPVTEERKYDKNIILYGPPGTGKTYYSAIYAVAICDKKSVEELEENYNDVMTRYNELKKEGRIAFTTFHQSYSYEEFIEGIKPIVDNEREEVSYTIEPGLFKAFCADAGKLKVLSEESPISSDARIWKLTIKNGEMNQIKQECFNEGNVRMGFSIDEKDARAFVEDLNIGDFILSLKTRKTIDGIAVVTGEAIELENKDSFLTSRSVKWLAKDIDVDITKINNGKMLHRMTLAKVPNMRLKDIIALCEEFNPELGHTEIEENSDPYVFIIDEINRGNISKIFGELITLIEDSKREGMLEGASSILPYSGEIFSVPNNVYIVGTMNTADRSIALMDTALRRRFNFIEMMPDVNVLRRNKADKVEDLDIAKMLEKINERITFLYDREHTIGHSFFLDLCEENATMENLQSIFQESIIPLLQEYFYEDYQKIQLVLGDNNETSSEVKFILDKKVMAKDIFKGSVEDIVDLPEKTYTINKDAFSNIESYKKIL